MNRKQQLLEMLQKAPHDSFLNHALALEHIREGQDEAAKAVFTALLALDPQYTGSYYHLAQLLERNGDIDGALEWYRRGMAATQAAGETRAYNELRSAYEELSED